jgi:hypothetical protein
VADRSVRSGRRGDEECDDRDEEGHQGLAEQHGGTLTQGAATWL